MPKLQSIPRQEELSSALAAFQLTESELTVYYSALALGTRPATQLAKHAGLNRPYTYDILFRLSEKGLVAQSVKNSVKQFTCTPPEALVDLLNRREQELIAQRAQLLRALPILQEVRSISSSQPGFRYFRGVDGIKRMLDQTLEGPGRVVLSFVQSPICGVKLEVEDAAYCKIFNRRREKRGISYFGIVSRPHDAAAENASLTGAASKNLLSLRRLSIQEQIPMEVFIYGQNVAILPDAKEYFGFVIENDAIAASARCVHDLIWKSLPSGAI